jgi:putative acetyltransferase
LILRRQNAAEGVAVRAVVSSAFGDHGSNVVRLLDALDAANHSPISLVAEDEHGSLAGHVQLSHSWLDAPERLVEVLVLSPLSVRPDLQGRGLGTTLIAAAIEAATAFGAPAVFLEGSPAYYGSRGFAQGSAHGFTRPSVRIPDAAFQVAVLPAYERWMTGAVAYCDAFWAADCVGLRDPHALPDRIEHSGYLGSKTNDIGSI